MGSHAITWWSARPREPFYMYVPRPALSLLTVGSGNETTFLDSILHNFEGCILWYWKLPTFTILTVLLHKKGSYSPVIPVCRGAWYSHEMNEGSLVDNWNTRNLSCLIYFRRETAAKGPIKRKVGKDASTLPDKNLLSTIAVLFFHMTLYTYCALVDYKSRNTAS